MGLVASSKIRRAQEVRIKSKQYANALSGIVDVLSLSKECEKSAYMQKTEGKDKIIVIAGDRGLAGGYNANVFRFARDYRDSEIVPIGKKACEHFGKEICSSEHFSYEDSFELASKLCEEFKNGDISRVGIIDTEYVSMIKQEPRISWVLPLEKKKKANSTGAIFEPDELTILEKSVPIYLAGLIYSATRESFASEVVARRSAMDSAGKNATTMIDELQLKYNRARQGTITQEITEIVAGSGDLPQ
jgi:F-type H+-transporting ATPase subunit gamma